MMTIDQLKELSKKSKISDGVIFREYLQILFLSIFYSLNQSERIFFKGGTAVHLIYKAPRFSEDLDFTVELNEKDFLALLNTVFEKISLQEHIDFKERKTIAGKRFLMSSHPSILPYKTFVNLDFSFREKALQVQKSIIQTDYPVIFTSYVYHLSKEEIFAEKIRALLTRKKGRDIYDLWYLASLGAIFESKLIVEKLKYYKLGGTSKKEMLERVSQFTEKDFILDLKPFIPVHEREKLPEFFNYIKKYLKEQLSEK